jgi:predicted metal-dependent hydrolase
VSDIVSNTLDWPPPYTVRRSLKARQILLYVKPVVGLEIVIPSYKQRFDIPKIIEDKRSWIEKMLKKLFFQDQKLVRDIENPIEWTLPKEFNLEAVSQAWQINYIEKTNQKRILLSINEEEQALLLSGSLENNKNNLAKAKRLLTQWLIRHAYLHLVPWITELSHRLGLGFEQLIIRGQNTLWGSCNAKKTISLNYKLLFLPHHLVQYVILHELCHLKHLNHSKHFWDLLEKWDPNYKNHKQSLKKIYCHVLL